jgi:hypothetical protein
MRYLAMQVLTWGTIAGAVGSALLLAAVDSPPLRYSVELPRLWPLTIEPTGAGHALSMPVPPAMKAGASAPNVAAR